MAKCAFGRAVVNDVFEAEYPFGTDIEGRFLYVSEADRQWLLATFDFSYMWRSTCLDWRTRVSEATGIPIPSIWVHTSQSHSAPVAPQLDGKPCEKLAELSIPVIQEMTGRAEESEVAYVLCDLGGRFNFRREQYIPELGAVTVWSGQLQVEGDLPPFGQDPSVMLLCGWDPGLPAFKERIYFDRPVDSQAALLVFRSRTGKVLGSLSRFSGHPDVAGAGCHLGSQMDQYRYHYDWPGCVRATIDAKLGGVGLCVNGPCGDVSVRSSWPDDYEQAEAEARRIGEGVANACMEQWVESGPSWENTHLGTPVTRFVQLPIRETLPHSRVEVPSDEEQKQQFEAQMAEIKKAQEQNEPPARIKRRIDDALHQSCVAKMVFRWADLQDEELSSRFMKVELQCLRLNDLTFCGLPGESMTDTSLYLKAQTIGSKLITFDQVNGYCVYLTTPEEYRQGGYSYWGGCLARDAEPIMRRAALELIRF